MLPDFRLRQREYLLEISRAMSARLDLSALLKLTLKSAVEILSGHGVVYRLMNQTVALQPSAGSIMEIRQVRGLFLL